jgi:hypothetical protein
MTHPHPTHTPKGIPVIYRAYGKFRVYKGLPPDGEPGTYLGWDADHNPYTLQWYGGCWCASGWSDDRPICYSLRESRADLIVAWAHSPVCDPVRVPEPNPYANAVTIGWWDGVAIDRYNAARDTYELADGRHVPAKEVEEAKKKLINPGTSQPVMSSRARAFNKTP